MVTKGLNKITQNETQDLQLVDNFCKSWAIKPLSKTQRECLKIFNTEEPVSKYVENIAVHNMIKYARKPHGDKAVN
jgi:hypothetical protein